MKNKNNKQDHQLLDINYSELMDLRVDYAFKITLTKGDSRLLISLLNAIFANKNIPRVIKSLEIKDPHLKKESDEDKLSILDIRARLDDGTMVLIEMHMYGLDELKPKTIRSWARTFGKDLEAGDSYLEQPPTIAIAFTDGQVKSTEDVTQSKADHSKIHKLCMIMDCEDSTIFTNAMELHYINMKAFAKVVNKAGRINIDETGEAMFAKWLSLITQKEIEDKTIIADICKEEEEIQMAVTTLARQGEDKYTRLAYQRRQDEIHFHNEKIARYERQIEQEQHRAEQEQRRAEQEQRRAEQAESEIERLRREIEELRASQKA